VEFDDLVKQTSDRLPKPERKQLASEVDRVQKWFDGITRPHGLGLVVFSCTPRDLWLTDSVPVAVRNHLAFEARPDVAGVLELTDDHERFAIALVSKDKARVFTVFAGEIEEIDAFRDFVPPRTDGRAARLSHVQRHHDMHVLWHLKKVVEQLSALYRRRNFDRLIIAGPPEATTELQRLLPPALKTRVAAVIRTDADATNRQILDNALQTQRRIEANAEERLVNEVVETAAAGGPATRGVRSTLEALWIGDVRVLLMADSLKLSGSECSYCHYLQPGTAGNCRICGASNSAVHDLGHQLARRTLEQRGQVEIVHGRAAEHLSTAGEGIAAFLRFSWPAGILESPGTR
jgi:peptide subunit release factor 1 (eRF1)